MNLTKTDSVPHFLVDWHLMPLFVPLLYIIALSLQDPVHAGYLLRKRTWHISDLDGWLTILGSGAVSRCFVLDAMHEGLYFERTSQIREKKCGPRFSNFRPRSPEGCSGMVDMILLLYVPYSSAG